MKLLVLSPVFPDAPCDGDRLRLYHWLQQLLPKQPITLACFTDPDREADQGPVQGLSQLRIHRVPQGRDRRQAAAALRLFSDLPVNVTSASSVAMQDLVDGLLATESFDAVLAYRLKMAPYALRFKGPRFLDYTDSMTRFAERRAVAERLAGHALAGRFWGWQATKLAAYETWCAAQFNASFFNSGVDRDAVAAMVPGAAKRLFVAANGVSPFDLGQKRRPALRAGSHSDVGRQMLFVGHLAYAPNADAVQWFATQVLPLVRAQEPQAEFVVVGGDAGPSLRELGKLPGVTMAGFAADTAPYVRQAAISVCPVRSGAGRQNKLLEAFAAGLPSVATSLAAQGAEAAAGKHLLVADDAQAFADAALRLLREPALGQRLAAQAQVLATTKYRWDKNASAMQAIMVKAMARRVW